MLLYVHTCIFWHGVFHKQALNQMNNSRQLEGMKKNHPNDISLKLHSAFHKIKLEKDKN